MSEANSIADAKETLDSTRRNVIYLSELILF